MRTLALVPFLPRSKLATSSGDKLLDLVSVPSTFTIISPTAKPDSFAGESSYTLLILMSPLSNGNNSIPTPVNYPNALFNITLYCDGVKYLVYLSSNFINISLILPYNS